jgi:hypothetical protein
VSEEAAKAFPERIGGGLVALWRDSASRSSAPLWKTFFMLPPDVQEKLAAGWEAIARKPFDAGIDEAREKRPNAWTLQ